MTKYTVSVGQSRTTKKWKRAEYTIDELYELCSIRNAPPKRSASISACAKTAGTMLRTWVASWAALWTTASAGR